MNSDGLIIPSLSVLVHCTVERCLLLTLVYFHPDIACAVLLVIVPCCSDSAYDAQLQGTANVTKYQCKNLLCL